MKISFDHGIVGTLEGATSREWLETNGLGGWASSTIAGANTRRYHGLLVASLNPPVDRIVLLSKLEEVIVEQDTRHELGCNYFGDVVAPKGFSYLRTFTQDLFPVFEYACGSVVVRKTVAAIHGSNTTLVLYDVIEAKTSFTLELRPFVAGRDYHSLNRSNPSIRSHAVFQNATFAATPYEGLPSLFIKAPLCRYEHAPSWYHNFHYPIERERGLDFQEDLFVYGTLRRELRSGDQFGVIISTVDPTAESAEKLFKIEEQRRKKLLKLKPSKDPLVTRLTLASDQFLAQRGADKRTIIAGYHWFTDWGRDTMIALPGIALVTGRHEEARAILQAFAETVSQGMLPNCFSDSGGRPPEYNTVDATLWFFVAAHRYLEYTGDDPFLRETLLPVLRDILHWHQRGTRYGIRADADGLLLAGEPGVQLTWMDAKVGDWVVTPRCGKPVEVNALWYNAFAITAALVERYEDRQAALPYQQSAEQVRKEFREQFWNGERGALYDCINGDERDGTIRPNQLFALSLPFELLSTKQSEQILSVVEEHLYTPVGLRSLSKDHPQYRGVYLGDQHSRDGAYHQGTVWSWLLGPYITALVRYRGTAGRRQAKKVIQQFTFHLSEAGVGTVSEIFDGDHPHKPRGCIAQAWSVGEILRAYVEDILGKRSSEA